MLGWRSPSGSSGIYPDCSLFSSPPLAFLALLSCPAMHVPFILLPPLSISGPVLSYFRLLIEISPPAPFRVRICSILVRFVCFNGIVPPFCHPWQLSLPLLPFCVFLRYPIVVFRQKGDSKVSGAFSHREGFADVTSFLPRCFFG